MALTFTPVNTISQGDVSGAQNTYNADIAQAQQAQQGLKQYQSTMVDPSKMYSENLASAQSQYGFNPADLLKANQNLAVTQTQMANLPQATQQQGNYYGTTAGAQANNYAQQAGNLQAVLAGQGNAVNAYQSTLNNILNQTGAQTQAGVQGQQMQLSALQNIYANAADQQKTALNQLQNLQDLFQKQGQFNSAQQAAYAQANAALTQASAAMKIAEAQSNALNIQSQANQYNLNKLLAGGGTTAAAGKVNPVNTPQGQALQNYVSQPVKPNYLDPSTLFEFMNPLKSPISPLAYLTGNR